MKHTRKTPKSEKVDRLEEMKKPEKSGLRAKWCRLSGVVRGLILLGLSLVLLAGVCIGVYKSFVKPVEIPKELEQISIGEDPTQTWTPPTRTETIKEVDPETGEETEVEVEVPYSHKEGVYNILLAGTDGDGGRTDTIMVAHIDTKTHDVCVLSVPRDTFIDANYSVPKINSAYGAGGMGEDGMLSLEVQLARILGFDVDGYILIDLQAFCEIVDLIGGVYFDVPCNMYYSDPTQNLYINLSEGYQLLDGQKAMQLCRFRSYPQADIARVSVQQDFVRALAKQCLQVVNISKVDELVSIIAENVVTDLSVENMAYFATELLKCDFENMETFTLPGEGISYHGGSYYMLYTQQVLEIVNEHFNPYDEDITAANVNIRTNYSSGNYTPVTVTSGSSTSSGSHGGGSSSSGSSSSSSGSNSGSTTVQPDPVEEPEPTEEPGSSENPENPNDPNGSGTTEEPNNPDGSGTTEDPNNPDGSGTTEEPNNPDGSGTTEDPNDPNSSGTTEDPNNPNGSGTTEDPNNPNGSGTTEDPSNANGSDTTPETPPSLDDMPGASTESLEPDVPQDQPDASTVPEQTGTTEQQEQTDQSDVITE